MPAHGHRHSLAWWGQMINVRHVPCMHSFQKLFMDIESWHERRSRIVWWIYSGIDVQQANLRANSDGHRFHNLPYTDLGSIAKPEVASQNDEEVASICPVIEPIDATSCVVSWKQFWLREALWPQRKLSVGTMTIACSPSIDSMKICLLFNWRVPSRYSCQFHYLPFELMSLRRQKWLRKMMQVAASIYQQSK